MTMRTLGVCASILASAQLLILPVPAFAQEAPPAPSSDAPPPADAKPADAKPADAKPADAKPAPSAEGTVQVHIESPTPVSLEKRDGATWSHVCEAPCDTAVSTSAEYRIMGTDLNESKAFMIDGSKGKVTLNVRPGYHQRAQQGMYVAIAGGVLLVGGILTIAIGSDGKTPFSGDSDTHLGNTNTIFIGSALILAGVCGGILGGAWMIDNAHTRVGGDVIKQNAPPSDQTPAGPVETKFQFQTSKREPTWNAPKVVGMPAAVTVPFLSRTF
jgi:hypothetical protein